MSKKPQGGEKKENSFDSQLSAFYDSHSLSKSQLEQLERQNNTIPFLSTSKSASNKIRVFPKQIKKQAFLLSHQNMRYAAIVIFFIGIIGTVTVFQNFNSIQESPTSLYQDYAEEVALNHQKQLPSDIKHSSILEINKQMDKLGFEISIPASISHNYTVLGARYCSVGKNLAAQIRLSNKEGNYATLYVAKSNLEFLHKNIPMIHEQVQNTRVTIWGEQSLRFFLATDIP